MFGSSYAPRASCYVYPPRASQICTILLRYVVTMPVARSSNEMGPTDVDLLIPPHWTPHSEPQSLNSTLKTAKPSQVKVFGESAMGVPPRPLRLHDCAL